MRLLMFVQFPVETFNDRVRDGTAGQKLQRILEATHPEACYFTEIDGHRAAVVVIDVEKASDIPGYAEPWFLNFDAKVELRTTMTPQEVASANLDKLASEWT